MGVGLGVMVGVALAVGVAVGIDVGVAVGVDVDVAVCVAVVVASACTLSAVPRRPRRAQAATSGRETVHTIDAIVTPRRSKIAILVNMKNTQSVWDAGSVSVLGGGIVHATERFSI